MLLTISVTVIAASVVVVAIVLIPVILQIRRTAREAEKILETTRMQVVPLSHDLTVISREVSSILQSVHRQMDRVEEGIATVQDGAERLRDFEEAILTTVETPLLELATVVRAVSRGIVAFLRFFRS
ncbi:MAG TPA: DUF948 domain-containing protein [Thermodesulfobacteriota bacterium]|nr:DUF948 domain-containing protein [Thermodesulfobacteriota bacterium]